MKRKPKPKPKSFVGWMVVRDGVPLDSVVYATRREARLRPWGNDVDEVLLVTVTVSRPKKRKRK